ncbi:MAG TPA: XdhC family protein [Acidimicrobiales bacterium]|nr:XdhC family protein [Acidimicrobiales bacterium]
MSDLVGDYGGDPAEPAAVVGFPPASNAGVRARATALRGRGIPFVMATVVRAERPTSAKAGDVAIVHGDGRIEGFVGGECAEASVRVEALRALETAEPVLLRISPAAAPPEEAVAAEDGTVTVHNPCLSGGTLEIFLEPEIPPPVMVVHGESPIARALASLAEPAGYVIELAGPRASPGEANLADILPGAAAVVVASHGRNEEALLESAVRAGVPYIGLVASRRRGAAVLERLDLPAEAKSRIHTPAGLDLGARGPQEIAVSILAEIIVTRRSRNAAGEDAPAAPPGEGGRAEAKRTGAVAIDPVCGMTIAALESTLSVEHDSKRYFFCGSGCKEAFVSDPEGLLGLS